MADPWSAMAQSTANLPALGMGMISARERNADRDEARALMQMRADEAIGLRRDQLAATQETAKQAALDRQAKLPLHQQIANPDEAQVPVAAILDAYGKPGVEALKPITDAMVKYSGLSKTSTKADVYKAVKSAYPAFREQGLETLEKHLQSDKLSPVERKRLGGLYNALYYDETGEEVLDKAIFSNTARSMKMEEAELAAKSRQAKAGAPPHISYGNRTEIFDADGNVVRTVPHGKVPGSGGTDELNRNIKMDKYHTQLTQQAMSQAGKETGLKYSINPTIQLNADGKPSISFPNHPEAHAFYVKKVAELTDAKVKQAVKRKALSQDYLPEASSVTPQTVGSVEKPMDYFKKNGDKHSQQAMYDALKPHYSDAEIAEAWRSYKGGR